MYIFIDISKNVFIDRLKNIIYSVSGDVHGILNDISYAKNYASSSTDTTNFGNLIRNLSNDYYSSDNKINYGLFKIGVLNLEISNLLLRDKVPEWIGDISINYIGSGILSNLNIKLTYYNENSSLELQNSSLELHYPILYDNLTIIPVDNAITKFRIHFFSVSYDISNISLSVSNGDDATLNNNTFIIRPKYQDISYSLPLYAIDNGEFRSRTTVIINFDLSMSDQEGDGLGVDTGRVRIIFSAFSREATRRR